MLTGAATARLLAHIPVRALCLPRMVGAFEKRCEEVYGPPASDASPALPGGRSQRASAQQSTHAKPQAGSGDGDDGKDPDAWNVL